MPKDKTPLNARRVALRLGTALSTARPVTLPTTGHHQQMSSTLQSLTEVTVPLDDLFFARLMPVPASDLSKILPEQKKMKLHDRLRSGAFGLMLGQSELFATKAARDAVLRPCGKHKAIIATTWPEAQTHGYSAAGLAIGHRLGDAGFDQVVHPVIDANVSFMICTSYPVAMVIARTRYEVAYDYDGEIVVAGDMSQFGFANDEQEIVETARWLQKAFNDRYFNRTVTKSANS
jgi:hypothetical protein